MNSSAYPSAQEILPEAASSVEPTAPGAPGMPGTTRSGAEMMVNPMFEALKVLGIGIKSMQAAGKPGADNAGKAFGGLLQSLSAPSVANAGQQAPQVPQAPAAPVAPAPVPQAQPAPVAPQAQPAPQPAAVPSRPASVPQGQRPFGQSAGQRPISKQPIII